MLLLQSTLVEKCLSGLLLPWRWCVMLCNFISGLKWWNQLSSLITLLHRKVHHPWQLVIEATMMTHPCMSVLFICTVAENPTGTNLLISQSSYYLLYGLISYAMLHCSFPNHHPSVLFDEYANFMVMCSVVALLSWPQCCWLVMSMFPFLLSISPTLLTLLVPLHASLYTWPSLTDICSWVALPSQEIQSLHTLTKWYVIGSNFVTVECRNISSVCVSDLYSYWRGYMLLPILYPTFYYIQHKLQICVIQLCSWLLVRPLYIHSPSCILTHYTSIKVIKGHTCSKPLCLAIWFIVLNVIFTLICTLIYLRKALIANLFHMNMRWYPEVMRMYCHLEFLVEDHGTESQFSFCSSVNGSTNLADLLHVHIFWWNVLTASIRKINFFHINHEYCHN
jgi:hypothetical protein